MQDSNKRALINLPVHQSRVRDASTLRVQVESAKPEVSNYSKTAGFGESGSQYAIPRVFDPARQKRIGSRGYGYNNYLDIDHDEESRKNLLDGVEVIMKTQPVMRACLEVYSRYPVAGAHLECKNKDVNDFFEEIFFKDLDYENFLIDVGREYWQYGEVFVNGVWDDSLGIWIEEELLDPRDMQIISVPFSSQNIMKFVPNADMKRIATGTGIDSQIFRDENPEFADLIARGEDILISPDRCVHLANKDSIRDLHGTPIALRAWNTLRLEDRLQSAMLATADRMYAPLLLFSLGGNLADGTPYIPSANSISTFRSKLDQALASDFRALVTNQFVNVQEVIRGDKMANFKNDIDMYDDRFFMAWGLSSSILKPQSGPYATSAMEFELASQMLSSYQKCLCQLYNRRAAFVAEAHEIYDYDIKGGVKVDKYEWREVWDPTAKDGEGSFVVKEVPKLLYPELKMETINFNTTEKTRDFLMNLYKAGIPVARQNLFMGTDIDYQATSQQASQDKIHDAITKAKEHQAIFKACVEQGLPVPPDTAKFIQDGIPALDQKDLLEKIMPKNDKEDDVENDPTDVTDPSDAAYDPDEYGNGARPSESDEMRSEMPKAASLSKTSDENVNKIIEDQMNDIRKKVGANESDIQRSTYRFNSRLAHIRAMDPDAKLSSTGGIDEKDE